MVLVRHQFDFIGTWRLEGGDVVGLHPAGRADRKAGLGAGGELARGPQVAAREGGLRGGEIGLGEVALAAIGHGELGIGVRRFRLARERGFAAACTASSAWALSLVAISAWPSMTWISAGLGASCMARRSGAIASAGLPAFEQRLALELVEIGVVRLRLDQGVDLRQRGARVGEAIGRDRARIARRQARVARADSGARRCPAGRGSRTAWRASGRGAPAAPAGPSCPNRGSSCASSSSARDALGRHRMRLQIGIDVARPNRALVGEPLEGVVHALGRLAGGGEELHAGAVGLLLLGADVGEQRALDHGLRRLNGRHPALAPLALPLRDAGDHRADAEQHGR